MLTAYEGGLEEMKIGFTELMVVFVVALLVIGPDKLPVYAKKLGEALQAFRKASDEMTKDLKESVIQPLDQAQQPLREALEPVNALSSQLQGNAREVEQSFKSIGKARPAPAEQSPQAAEEPSPPAEPVQAQSSQEATGGEEA